MITYTRTAFGLGLIFRVHGSAVYRSVFPSLVSVGVFFLIRRFAETNYGSSNNDEVGHPYAIGVLVASTTFLLVFRANQGYARYWEACSAVHHMMSKWMDATTHTGQYHLQCAHYESIKPPSYFEYPELNSMFLTRDRERGWEPPPEYSSERIPEIPPPVHHRYPVSIRSLSGSDNHLQDEERMRVQTKKMARAVAKSINKVNESRKEKALKLNSQLKREQFKPIDEEKLDKYFETESMLGGVDEPAPLLGKGRMDGNWGALFDDGKATFYDPKDPDFVDPQGFAGFAGGRTAPLFLQELAHLSSLMSAVALATLRNDVDGAESPLDFYEPGSDWPTVDPWKDEWFKVRGVKAIYQLILMFFGVPRTPEERTRYNATRPLPVIGGVSDNEIKFLQMARGPYAKTQLCWQWLSEFCIREHLAGSTGKVGPPIISRVIQFLGDGMIYYNHARKIMFIPFPFVHAQLSALFVWVLIPTIPLLMDQYAIDDWLGALLTFATIMCLSGIDEVAREMENPFRNVPNEIPLCTLQAHYNEALITMFAGYHPDHYWDGARAIKRGERQKQREDMLREEREAREAQQKADEREEIELLKKQLNEQSKLIEKLAAKVGSDPKEESRQLENLVVGNGT